MEPGPDSKITGWREEKSEADFFHNVGLLAMKEAELVHGRLKGWMPCAMMENAKHSMTENIESLMKRLRPTSARELEEWIQIFPKELGLRLLDEHWQLVLPRKPGPWAAGVWGSMQKRVPFSIASAMRGTLEENRKYLEAKRLQREENLRKYLEELDAHEKTAE